MSGKALRDLACLEVKVAEFFDRSEPQFLQNKEVLEFLILQLVHFLCFRFFFSSVNITVSKSFSTLKFSSRTQTISVLRLPESRNKERTATARSRKYSLSMALARSNALRSSSSPMTVSRLSLTGLPLTRVICPSHGFLLTRRRTSSSNRRRVGEVEAS